MRLEHVSFKNFRGYGDRVKLRLDDLTVLVGRNDVGKSTVLEALNIVLGGGKIDSSDVHIGARAGDVVLIECAFSDLPSKITLDSGSLTSLGDEYLLDKDGLLRLQWRHPVSIDEEGFRVGKAAVSVVANHPENQEVNDLHSKSNSALKKLIKSTQAGKPFDLRDNASMRAALWRHTEAEVGLELKERNLGLSKEDGKTILSQIEQILPIYALFQADRPSTDQDAEVQDPMKIAIRNALNELEEEVAELKSRVEAKAREVADRTLESLRDFDADLAESLTPEFAEPRLESAFKLSLIGDDGIAVNKRGSGVRRLVLFSFFRAEAERKQREMHGRSVIYAVEEPETAQHPEFQRKVVAALQDLAETDRSQVLITTHSPGLTGLLPAKSLRLIASQDGIRSVFSGADAQDRVVGTLGIVPDHRVRLLLCVEGIYDKLFLQAACRAYRAAGEDLVCLTDSPKIIFVPLGGTSLIELVSQQHFKELQIPEFHIYDRDVPRYVASVDEVNGRNTEDFACLTSKREMENYLHPDAIYRVLHKHASNLEEVEFGDDDDVSAIVSRNLQDHNGNSQRKIKGKALKRWLNDDVARAMTADEFRVQDPDEEVLGWLRRITETVRDVG